MSSNRSQKDRSCKTLEPCEGLRMDRRTERGPSQCPDTFVSASDSFQKTDRRFRSSLAKGEKGERLATYVSPGHNSEGRD